MRPHRAEAVIFLHLPRTGGITMEGILRRKYRPEEIYDAGIYPYRLPTELGELPKDQLARIRAVYGHMRFGAHEFLPQPAQYLTLLRDPVERTLSQYSFLARNAGAKLYEKFVSKGIGLHEYAERDTMFVNAQTRDIAGADINSIDDLMSPELLEQAKRNIEEHFAVVGVVARFDETLLLANDAFGWKGPLFYRRANASAGGSGVEDIPEETRRLIEERNRLDVELYRFAADRLKADVAGKGTAFQRRLRSLHFTNAVFAKIPEWVFSLRDAIVPRPRTAGAKPSAREVSRADMGEFLASQSPPW